MLFSDVPCVWLRKDHPALHEKWDLDTFLRYPHISICWEQSDTWALDNVLQELGRERTIAMSLPEFEQSLFMAAQPDNLLGDRAALLPVLQSTPPTAVGCSSSPV